MNCGHFKSVLTFNSIREAALHIMKARGEKTPPCTVTSEFHVKLKRVTPSEAPVRLRARVVGSSEDRATVEVELEAGGKTTSTCRGVFVAVREGHPAYHRW